MTTIRKRARASRKYPINNLPAVIRWAWVLRGCDPQLLIRVHVALADLRTTWQDFNAAWKEYR